MQQKSFLQLITGTNDFGYFLACLFFAVLGAILVMFLGAKKGKKKASYSPAKLDWEYFWNDNTKRIAGTSILIFISIRFMPYFYNYLGISGFIGDELNDEAKLAVSFLLGLGSDKLSALFKKLGILKNDPTQNPANTKYNGENLS